MKNIPVKIDKIYIWILIISIIFVLISIFIENIFWWILWIIAFSLIFLSTFSLKYMIKDEKLIIKYFYLKKEISIKEITKVRNFKQKFTKKFNFSLSLDGKIKIFYEKDEKYIIIAPKNKREFLENLADINSEIDFDL